ncbi:uncharacterized protein [Chironomus tepperi]|uniref:uncharacterized protein n=1 Tax=Chironomus tepperi TaxID=113505 RepID=UPI00391F9199
MPKVSNRAPRVPRTEYTVKKTKNCAYCKNHDLIKPEKDHKPNCSYNNAGHFSVCKPCMQNHKKSENVKRWREKQRNEQNPTESVNIQEAVGDLLEECLDGIDIKFIDGMLHTIGVHEEAINEDEKMEVEEVIEETIESQIADLSSYFKDTGLTIAILPSNYPENILTEDNVNELQSSVENMIDQLPIADLFPRFKSSIYEFGYWRVSCVDEFTKDWFINYIATSTSFDLIQILSIDQIPKHHFTANIPEKPFEITKILRMIHKQNSNLDTSRWEILQSIEYAEGFTVTFEVDPLSFNFIKMNNHYLNFGMDRLEVTVIVPYKKY